jgi:hemolysin III
MKKLSKLRKRVIARRMARGLVAPGDHAKLRQELANSITHGIAAALSLVALGALVMLALLRGNALHLVSFSLFGMALVFLFSASAMMHFHQRNKPAHQLYEFLDYAGIYLVIAATYTPFCLITLQGAGGWVLFGMVWFLAVAGTLLSLFLGDRFTRYANGVYLVMGWLVVIFIKPLAAGLSTGGLALLFGGGLAYTIGVIVLVSKRHFHSHALWHLFVGLGALLHMAAMIFYVLPDLR